MYPRQTIDNRKLLARLRDIAGRRHVLTSAAETERFRKGFRSGEGEALAVVQPGDLIEMWRVLKACVSHDKIVIMQAANTGLTEGSTPSGRYDRDVVLINPAHGSDPVVARRTAGDRFSRFDLVRPGKAACPAGTPAAFRDRFVLHRRVDRGWGLQQLGRIAGRTRAILYGAVSVCAYRFEWATGAGQPFGC